jgi:DNA-binding CsgD family transcriptional regulator
MTAIGTVMAGRIHLSPTIEVKVLQNLFPDLASRKVDLSKCSDRELQVFELLGVGRSTREIGEHLKLSPKTVETYRENLKKKLRLQDGAALLRAATLWAESGVRESGEGDWCGWGVRGGRRGGLSGALGYAAFLQNAGLGRGGTQSGALGWYTVSRWDTDGGEWRREGISQAGRP